MVVGTPGLGYTGTTYGAGVNGPWCIFFGSQPPNNFSDPAVDRPTKDNCDAASTYHCSTDGNVWRKPSFSAAWVTP